MKHVPAEIAGRFKWELAIWSFQKKEEEGVRHEHQQEDDPPDVPGRNDDNGRRRSDRNGECGGSDLAE
jgi:hypothetical protein